MPEAPAPATPAPTTAPAPAAKPVKAPAAGLVRVKVPDNYGAFEDAHGKTHPAGAVVEVTPRVAEVYGLKPEK